MAADPDQTRSNQGAAQARGAGLRLRPKEHGASFMSVHALLLGIVAALSAGGRDLAGLLLALAFGALFLPLTAALSTLTNAKLAARARRRTAALGSVMATLGALALFHGPARELLEVGGTGAVLAAAYALTAKRTGTRSIPTQLAAIAGISLLAPLAWLLMAGPTERWPLAAPAAFISFGGTVPYVRERVRRRRFQSLTLGERLRGGAVAMLWQVVALALTGAGAAAGVVHPLVPVALLAGAVKTFTALTRLESKPPIRRIGFLETGISTVFAVLAGIGLGVAPLA